MTNIRNRIVEFDYIRVISLLGILVCHSCFAFNDVIGWFGKYLALTFNFLFLVLSAFLLGSAWSAKGHNPYSIDFLKHRIVRLSSSYYPYLVALFIFLYFSQDLFSIRNIISHFLYLPWLDKIDGYGHLWFLTMIVICYLGCWTLSKWSGHGIENDKEIILYVILAVGAIVLDYVVNSLGMPGYLFPYLVGYMIVFRWADEILKRVRTIKMWPNVIQFVVINLCSIYIFHEGIFDFNPFAAYLIGIVCACSVFCFLFNICSRFPASQIIIWLSGISFEIYLVHEFLLGRHGVYKYIDNIGVVFLVLIVGSTVLAVSLKYLSKLNQKLLSKL